MALASPGGDRARLAGSMADASQEPEASPAKRSLQEGDPAAAQPRKRSRAASRAAEAGLEDWCRPEPEGPADGGSPQLAQGAPAAEPLDADGPEAGGSGAAASQPAVRGRRRAALASQQPQPQTQAQAFSRNEGPFQPVEAGGSRGHAGQIKRLELENFMCHEHLVVDFIPRVNFICGQNGSGKTAVLHGLQTCLGVTARQSGRAATAVEFIRDGAAYCKASATMWNTGEDAFLPRKLGPEVTVVRELRRTPRSGTSSSWAILDARGRKVASKKADVDELLRSLSVNAANPIVCLTQDTARSFGSGREAAERFRVFMEATQFNLIIERLRLAEAEVDSMRAQRADVRALLQERQEQLRGVEHRLDSMAEVAGWEAAQAQLQAWGAWEAALEPRRAAEDCRAKLEGAAQQHMQQRQAQLAQAEAAVQQAQQEHEAQGSALADFPQRMAQLQEEHQAQQAVYQGARREAARCGRAAAAAERALGDARGQAASLAEAVAEVQAQLQETAQGEEQASAAAVKAKVEEAAAADADAHAARQEIRVAHAAAQEAGDAVRAADGVRGAATAKVRELQTALERLRSQQGGDTVGIFAAHGRGRELAELVRRVQQAAAAGRFERPPLGPLGSLLALTDDRWATAVEAAVGRSFGDFIVHCHRDAQLLRALAREVRLQQPGIIVYSYDHAPYNLAGGRQRQVPEGLPTVFRVLRPLPGPHAHVVSNVLVDSCAAERLLLVQDEAEGMRHVRGPLGAEGVIQSAWDARGWHGFRRRHNQTSVPWQGGRLVARLRKDVAGAVAEAQEELAGLQAAAAREQAAADAARAAERTAKQGLEAARRAAARATQRKVQLDSQLAELRTQHATQAQADESSVEDLDLQLAEARREVAAAEAQLGERQAEAAAAKAAEAGVDAALRERKREIDRQIQLHEGEMDAQAASLQRVQDAEAGQQQAQAAIVKLQEAVAKLEATEKEHLAAAERALEKARQACDEAEFEAARQALGPGLEQRRQAAAASQEEEAGTVRLLARWLREIEGKIAARERQVGASREELEEAKAGHEQWLATRGAEAAVLDHNYQLFAESYRQRREAARRMRRSTLSAVETAFNGYLHQRGFTGKLELDAEAHTLHLQVKMDRGAAQAVADMKSLSGGERSFTNMCFIMAVGQDVSSPFHCLDEFDVFMDAVNRKVAVELLMRFGALHEHLQLILLTPQATHVIEDAKASVRRLLKEAWPAGEFITAKAMEAPRPRAQPASRR